MAYPQTGSILTGEGGVNRTGTSLSTNIIIMVGDNPVGAVQQLQITEARNIAMIDEVGTDGHIDSAPQRATDISGNCQRIRFDRLRITEAFSRGFLHVHAQRIPFDIVILDKWQGDVESTIITTIKNVWIEQINYTYNANDYLITDTMSWKAETIYSTLGTGGINAATGGARGLPLAFNAIERDADRGGRRGALDAPGLLTDITSII